MRLSASLLIVLLLGVVPAEVARAGSADLLLTTTGEASSDFFGYAVAGDIDFNADGFPDVVVGAPNNTVGGGVAGRVYVYFGGPGSDNVADVIMTGGADDYFGWSLAKAGDVNGDGFDDLIVGALDCCLYKGMAFIYLGGPAPNNVSDLTLLGAVNDDLFGWSVGAVGDFNGDNFDDVIVGAPQNDSGGSNAGRAYVYLGGATLNAVADLTLTGEGAGDQFGYAVSGAGDVNSDGFADLLVGAPFNDAAGTNSGRGYLYYGGASLNNVADLVMTGAAAQSLGRAVSTAGDMNGDGFADVALGAWSTNASTFGGVEVFYGGVAPNASADVVLTASTAGDSLGLAVAAVGDADGDGYDDLLVGAPGSNLGGNSSGAAFLYRGGPALDGEPDLELPGASSIDHFGSAVARGGDSNGDGRPDLLVGANTDNSSGLTTGRAYLYAMTGYRVTSPDGGEQWVAGRPATVRWEGRELTDIGVSGDGGATWVTVAEDAGGAPENSYTLLVPELVSEHALVRIRMAGQVISPSTVDVSDAVFRIVAPHEPPDGVLTLERTVNGAATGDQFGGSLAPAGDVNHDGFADVIVGAASNGAGGAGAGRAYVYYGGRTIDGTADLTVTGAAAGDLFGSAVAGAGDVNGDGFDDLLVGAYQNDAVLSNAGRAYVYYGGVAPDAVADLTFSGSTASENFGTAVAGPGDVNGDGYDDLLVGSPFNDLAGTNTGAAFVFYGGPAADAVADLTFNGAAVSDNLGLSVAGAGDVNGDGFADLIAGAPGNDAGGSASGRAYVYFGGTAADAVADMVLTGRAASDQFGSTVAGGQDLDGDGFDDVAVGARLNDDGGVNTGQVQLFFGGRHPDSEADLTLTGGSVGEQYGTSVALLPDLNGDGYADLAVGAPVNGAGGVSAGRAYIYYGGPGMDTVADRVITGPAADQLGQALAGPGDMNGDDFGDLVVGSRQLGAPNGPGRAQILVGARYDVTAPAPGATWNVGALETVAWQGAEPADLYLSVDGGTQYALLSAGLGGQAENRVALRVPHQPTRFARVQLRPHDPATSGAGTSDSLFTIVASIALLNLKAEVLPGRGVQLEWNTDPGPERLSGYRLERSGDGATWSTLVERIRETSWLDAGGQAGHRYRLHGVNGLGEEMLLGEAGPASLSALVAWPLPYRGGALSITFLTAAGPGGRPAPTEVALFDPAGRRIRTLVSQAFTAGAQSSSWDGRDDAGRAVASGIYFLRATTGGAETRIKLPVVR